MPEYQGPNDLSLAKDLAMLAPQEAQAFMGPNDAAERSDGVISAKYCELISIAVALTMQCAYCIDAHTKNALRQVPLGRKLQRLCLLPRLFGRAQPWDMVCLHCVCLIKLQLGR